MGYATIVSGGEDGRYTITMDYGQATRDALLAALSVLLAELDVKIAAAQGKVNEADAKEAEAEARYNDAVDTFIASNPFFAPGSPRPDDSAIRFALARLRELQMAHQPLRVALAAVKLDKSIALKRVAYWNTFVATNTRQAWCTDFTEDAAPGAVVATMEIPGDDNLIIIAPGARAWTPADGYLAARELMSPEQVFFNAAIFPGWQIDKPTYRWGTITAIDRTADTCSVSLAPARSTAQRLPINRVSTLANVPIEYQDCDSDPFIVGDNVVVQFVGQSWDNPKVVGFVDTPKRCPLWPANVVGSLTYQTTVTASGATRAWGRIDTDPICGPMMPSFDTAATVAPTATHNLVLGSAWNFGSPPADPYTIEVSGGSSGTLVSWTSDAFGFSTNVTSHANVPQSGAAPYSYSHPPGLGLCVRRSTASYIDSITLPAVYEGGAACTVVNTNTGGSWGSSSPTVTTVDIIAPIAPQTWLAANSHLPTIIVTNPRGVRRYYNATSYADNGSVVAPSAGFVILFTPGAYVED